MARRVWAATGAVILVLAGCGGDDDASAVVEGAGDAADGGDDGGSAGGVADGGDDGSGSELIGTDGVALTTDPGTAVVEVDGERLVYEAAGSVNFVCSVAPGEIRINFQTPEGQDLSMQAVDAGSGWSGQLVFQSDDLEQVQYNAVLGRTPGTLGVGDGAFSFQGPVDKVVDRDIANAEAVDAELAVNCAPAGDGSEPTAEIDGQEYVVPFSGAQSVSCEVSPTDVDIAVNRLALENLQLSIDMRGGPDDWIGSVFVITPDGNFTATLSGAAEGLVIDGSTVTYAGPIVGDDGTEVPAEVAITCP